MIPKTIHYCWFGGKDKPAEFTHWLKTWKFYLPDYEIKEWNETNFDIGICAYSREAYAMRSYAHVSDVCRAHVLSCEGGIYFDTDIEVCRNLDSYLAHHSFAGMESHLVGTGVLGTEPGTPWVAKLMDYYRHTHFINRWGHPVRTPNTRILTERVLPLIDKNKWPAIYPIGTFGGINPDNGAPLVSPDAACIHHFSASWRTKRTLANRIATIIKGLAVRHLKLSR